MTRKVRALILSGMVGLAAVLGSGATTARAQGFGPYGPGPGRATSANACCQSAPEKAAAPAPTTAARRMVRRSISYPSVAG